MWQNFVDFMGEPFRQDMDAFQWFKFVGLVIAILILWAIILKHVREAI